MERLIRARHAGSNNWDAHVTGNNWRTRPAEEGLTSSVMGKTASQRIPGGAKTYPDHLPLKRGAGRKEGRGQGMN